MNLSDVDLDDVDNLGEQLHLKQNRNRLINDAYCCQVMPGRKSHLNVLKGACRCELWIENWEIEEERGSCCWKPILCQLSLSLPPPLSLTYSCTQKNTHLLFRLSPSHSLEASFFLLQCASPFLSLFAWSAEHGAFNWTHICIVLLAAATVWITAKMCRWPGKDWVRRTQSGGKIEGYLRGGTLLVFVQLLWWEINWQETPKNQKTRGDAVR